MLSGEFGEAQELLVIKIVTDEMGLDIEDELARQGLGSRARQFGFARLGRCNLEHVRAIDLVHSDERRGHAATRLHELPSAQAKSFAVFLGQLEDPPLDTIWVGIGVAADAVSAPATRRCSRSLSQLPIVASVTGSLMGRD